MNRRFFLPFILFVLLMLAHGFIEPMKIYGDMVELVSKDVPASFEGYKVAYITDIHSGPFMNKNRLMALAREINEQQPDVVLLGGDYVRYSPFEFKDIQDFLAALKPKDGIFYVFGNHDYWADILVCAKTFKDAGATLLINNSAAISRGEDKILLLGTDDFIEGSVSLMSTYEGVNPEDFAILMAHNPKTLYFLREKYGSLTDIALMGHTHEGQVSLFGFFNPLGFNKFLNFYTPTLREWEGIQYIVSNGFGMSGAPVRFFCPPTYHLITLSQS